VGAPRRHRAQTDRRRAPARARSAAGLRAVTGEQARVLRVPRRSRRARAGLHVS
jgi:hypothetical protein